MRPLQLTVAILLVFLRPPALSSQSGTWSSMAPGTDNSQSTIQILAPESVQPGDPVVVALLGETTSLVVTIRTESGELVARGSTFFLALTPQFRISCAILGLATTTLPGQCLVEVVSQAGDLIATRSLMVESREFRSEEIALSSSLSDLRESEDPRKTDEARLLQAITAEFNNQAVYHTGPYVWPIPLTRRTSLFGDRRTYLYADGERAGTIHEGLDLAAPTGTPVVASGSGLVRFSDSRIVTGKTVVIEHLPGVFSVYYHMDTLSVTGGELVGVGQTIGTVGATGLATGPHLHWEFRIGGVRVDPEHVLPGLLVDFDR